MTFAELSDGEGSGRRDRSFVRERARELERREGKEDGEGEEAIMASLVTSSSVMSKESGDGEFIGFGGGKEEDSMMQSGASAVASSSEVVED